MDKTSPGAEQRVQQRVLVELPIYYKTGTSAEVLLCESSCSNVSEQEHTASTSASCEEITEAELEIDLADLGPNSAEIENTAAICRICHSGGTEEVLIAPCRCCGSTKFAHQSCLLFWFDRKRNKTCELCLYEVEMKTKGFKPPTKWKLPSRTCDFVACLFTFYCFVLLAFIGMVLWVATTRCITPVCVVLYFVCAVAMLYFTYCCGCVRQIRGYWASWLDLNRDMLILSRTDTLPAMLDFKFALVNSKDTKTRGRSVNSARHDISPPPHYMIKAGGKRHEMEQVP